jgi:tetratricopeptide (TPR) repeat protein
LLREAGVDLAQPDAVDAARTSIAALRARDAGLADALIELLHVFGAMPGLDGALRTNLATLLGGYESAHAKSIAAARTRWDNDKVDTFGPLLEEQALQELGADQLADLAGALIAVPDRAAQWPALLDRAILMKPDSYKLHFMRGAITLGLASRAQGLDAERLARTAVMHLQAAIALRPRSGLARATTAAAQAVLALATEDRGGFLTAWQTMESATRVDPDNAVVWFFRADFLRRSPGRNAQAIAACTKALELDPDFTPAKNLLAELQH